ncbi:TonB-dependent receptor [Pseudoduganella albidiflava]|uniref:TonB-dependent receptor n=2 Tax=Pseudoduganella albidiflava TaxID=321983 RepID=A0ABX5RTI8_9BURK|nr:TonB-dependent receptor [Pseudoduganella albidiflava]QBI01933.1 TonB-dependent receptor [Pseudoduganella albidiflava]
MKRSPYNLSKTTLAIASACCAMAASATAQQTEPSGPEVASSPVQAPQAAAPAPDNGSSTFQEVIVTATRHSTSLLKTPVSMTAVTQEALTRQGITDVRGLSGQIPNLQLGSAPNGSSGVKIAIRGVSSNDFTEIGNPAVGLHVAGLYSPRPQAALGLLFDLEQVEVLRGPQGTLFGRNSTAGSINIIPARPEFGNRDGKVEAEVGNYNHRQVSVVQNIGINERWALRATYSKLQRDSYLNQSRDFYAPNFPSLGITPALDANGAPIPAVDQRHNAAIGRDKWYNNKDEYAYRLQSRLKVTNDVEWRLAYEKYQNDGAGDISLKDCRLAAGTPYACPGSQWDITINTPGEMDMSIDTVRTGLSWNINAGNTLEYNAAYATQKRRQIIDTDLGYQPVLSDLVNRPGTSPYNDQATFTTSSKYVSRVHELQLRGQVAQVRYVTGLFWLHEKNAIDFGQDYLANASGTYGYPTYAYLYHQTDRQADSKAVFAQADWTFAPRWTVTAGARYTRDKRTDSNGEYYDTRTSSDRGIYFLGQYTPGVPGTPGYQPFNSTHLLPGMGAYYGLAGLSPTLVPQVSNNAGTWKKATWRLGLNYQATPKDMLFTSLSTGYKAGGFSDVQNICANGLNGNCADRPPGPHYTNLPWEPETVTNLEFGYKGRLFGDKLSLSATVFHSRYDDMQLTGGVTVGKIIPKIPCSAAEPYCDVVVLYGTTNAAKSAMSGLELEGQYRPQPGTRINYAYGYLRAKVRSYPGYSENRDISCNIRTSAGAPPCVRYTGTDPALRNLFPVDITGHDLPNAPRHSVRIDIAHDFELANGYTLTPWLAARWQDKMYFTLRNLDTSHVSDAEPSYGVVDAALRLEAPNGKWHVEAYVKNAGDTISKNFARVVEPGYVLGSYNDPRMFGVRVGARW